MDKTYNKTYKITLTLIVQSHFEEHFTEDFSRQLALSHFNTMIDEGEYDSSNITIEEVTTK